MTACASSLLREGRVHLAGFLDYLQAECGLSINTRKAYELDLRRFLTHLQDIRLRGLEKLSPRDIEGFLRAERAGERAVSSVARSLAAVKMFCRYLVIERLFNQDPSTSIETPKKWHRLPNVLDDEATTSLDVIVEAKLLDEFVRLRDEFDLTILMITHNIALVAQMADRVAVMYAGQMAEIGDVVEVFDNPLHPYTDGLLKSVPNIKLDEREKLYKMGGEPPNLTHPPMGCRFHPRCPKAMPICRQLEPRLMPTKDNPSHLVHCWLYEERPDRGEADHE